MTIKKVDETLLTDEKICKVNPLRNSQNNRVYASVSIKSGIPRKRFWTKPQDHSGSVVISAGTDVFRQTRSCGSLVLLQFL